MLSPIAVVIALTLGGAFVYVHKERRKTKRARVKLLKQEIETARQERLLLKETNPSLYNFHHPKYQVLWDKEMGAEAVYILAMEELGEQQPSICWNDYCRERDAAEEKDDN
jgi:hypothetical protein